MDLLDTQDLWDGPGDRGQERWTPIDQFYSISDYGRVWASYTPRNQTWDNLELLTLDGRQGMIKHTYPDKDGYLNVGLRTKRVAVHRLVALHWIANPLDLPFVLHCDGNPRNNHFRNLRWGTPRMNTLDSQKHGTFRNGSDRPSNKGSYDVELLYRLVDQGVPIKQIARRLGIFPSSVRYRIKTRV